MSFNGRDDLRILSGNANIPFAKSVAERVGIKLVDSKVSTFSDGESSVTISESVRGADVFLIQSTCEPVNHHMMEMLLMVDALKRASAGRINAVIPYFGYARQDRKAKARDPISAKLCANLITAAGVDRVVTMDLHALQIQGFFDIPVDHLLGKQTILPYYLEKFKDEKKNLVVLSPDLGSVTRSRAVAESMNIPFAVIDKRRPMANESEVMNIIGDVEGKKVIIIDDLIDTAGTLCNAADAVVTIGGATAVYAAATHGVLSGPARSRIAASRIEELVVLDTIPIPKDKMLDKMKIISVTDIFAEAICRIHDNQPISALFSE